MRYYYTLLFFVTLLITLVISCKKENKTDGCFPGAATIRQIENKQAVIKLTATTNPVYIVEQGSIDTRLIPCNLPMDFFQDDLQVVISGEVKSTSQSGGVCCIENIVITKITR